MHNMQTLVKHRVKAAIYTAIIFTILVLILLWVHFRTPIPPYPEGGGGPGMGIEVNLGTDDQGMGTNQAELPVNIPGFVEEQPSAPDNEQLLTADNDESESIKDVVEDKPVKKEIKKETKKQVTEKPKEKPIKEANPQAEKPKVNEKALFPPRPKGNEGISGQAGDQGKPEGTAGSPLYTGTGSGSGGGTGGGSGTGTGTGIGDGVSFSLEGRSPTKLEAPKNTSQAEGKVVVEITVDKNGKVISAIAGVKGSTTLDEYLLSVAEKAALQSTFSRKPDATIQKGTITYRFVLQ